MKNFNLLFITDIHQNITHLKKINFSSFDAVLCAGDFLDSAAPDTTRALEALSVLPKNTFFVPGNCDASNDLLLLLKEKKNFIERKYTTLFPKIPIAGIGYSRDLREDLLLYRKFFLANPQRISNFIQNGGPPFILRFCGIEAKEKILITDPYPLLEENQAFFQKFVSFQEEELLKFCKQLPSLENGILLTHSPPYGTLDQLNDLPHIGSKAIETMVTKKKPALVLCGHFHELAGTVHIGTTKVFNPGALAEGRYGVIEYNGDYHCRMMTL